MVVATVQTCHAGLRSLEHVEAAGLSWERVRRRGVERRLLSAAAGRGGGVQWVNLTRQHCERDRRQTDD